MGLWLIDGAAFDEVFLERQARTWRNPHLGFANQACGLFLSS